jgi:hypothetical protein
MFVTPVSGIVPTDIETAAMHLVELLSGVWNGIASAYMPARSMNGRSSSPKASLPSLMASYNARISSWSGSKSGPETIRLLDDVDQTLAEVCNPDGRLSDPFHRPLDRFRASEAHREVASSSSSS